VSDPKVIRRSNDNGYVIARTDTAGGTMYWTFSDGWVTYEPTMWGEGRWTMRTDAERVLADRVLPNATEQPPHPYRAPAEKPRPRPGKIVQIACGDGPGHHLLFGLDANGVVWRSVIGDDDKPGDEGEPQNYPWEPAFPEDPS
jgi:hypothetical protein